MQEQKHYYFMGIGGIGMSGIAEILLDSGYQVSGSDIKVSSVTERLQKKGAVIHIGQKTESITEISLSLNPLDLSSFILNSSPILSEPSRAYTMQTISPFIPFL